MTQATDTDKTILEAIDKLDHKIDTLNEKFDNCQKASRSVVNLAFWINCIGNDRHIGAKLFLDGSD